MLLVYLFDHLLFSGNVNPLSSRTASPIEGPGRARANAIARYGVASFYRHPFRAGGDRMRFRDSVGAVPAFLAGAAMLMTRSIGSRTPIAAPMPTVSPASCHNKPGWPGYCAIAGRWRLRTAPTERTGSITSALRCGPASSVLVIRQTWTAAIEHIPNGATTGKKISIYMDDVLRCFVAPVNA